jgi:hypothetical protein
MQSFPYAKETLRGLLIALRTSIAVILAIDGLARPLYRPLLQRIADWKLMQAFEALVARLPRLAILVLFGVPFVVAEPLKIVALFEMAEGNVIWGLALLIFSYLVTFILVERIYHAGKEKLLTYTWFAWTMGQVTWVRDSVLPYKVKLVRKANAVLRYFRKSAA